MNWLLVWECHRKLTLISRHATESEARKEAEWENRTMGAGLYKVIRRNSVG